MKDYEIAEMIYYTVYRFIETYISHDDNVSVSYSIPNTPWVVKMWNDDILVVNQDNDTSMKSFFVQYFKDNRTVIKNKEVKRIIFNFTIVYKTDQNGIYSNLSNCHVNYEDCIIVDDGTVNLENKRFKNCHAI